MQEANRISRAIVVGLGEKFEGMPEMQLSLQIPGKQSKPSMADSCPYYLNLSGVVTPEFTKVKRNENDLWELLSNLKCWHELNISPGGKTANEFSGSYLLIFNS